MAISIPQTVFDTYQEFADAMINDLGINCRLVYPKRQIPCPLCTDDTIGNKGYNKFASGGPMPSIFSGCHFCGGDGFKEEEATEDIKLRVYTQRKFFVKLANITVPDDSIQIIGFIYDLPKMQQATEIIMNIDQENYGTWRFAKDSEPMPWGLLHNKYFVTFLNRA